MSNSKMSTMIFVRNLHSTNMWSFLRIRVHFVTLVRFFLSNRRIIIYVMYRWCVLFAKYHWLVTCYITNYPPPHEKMNGLKNVISNPYLIKLFCSILAMPNNLKYVAKCFPIKLLHWHDPPSSRINLLKLPELKSLF